MCQPLSKHSPCVICYLHYIGYPVYINIRNMIDGKTFRQGLDKFFKSPTCQGARVQIELPNGEMYDITGAKLLENRIIGSKESHRLVLTCKKPTEKMGKIIKSL